MVMVIHIHLVSMIVMTLIHRSIQVRLKFGMMERIKIVIMDLISIKMVMGRESDQYGGTDCDDTDATIFAATEIWYDGTDQDCDAGSDFDQDGDGEDPDQHGGTDCDDTNSAINTFADDGVVNVDGIDDNCNGIADEDLSLIFRAIGW